MEFLLQAIGVFFASAVLGGIIGWAIVSLVMRYFDVKELYDE